MESGDVDEANMVRTSRLRCLAQTWAAPSLPSLKGRGKPKPGGVQVGGWFSRQEGSFVLAKTVAGTEHRHRHVLSVLAA